MRIPMTRIVWLGAVAMMLATAGFTRADDAPPKKGENAAKGVDVSAGRVQVRVAPGGARVFVAAPGNLDAAGPVKPSKYWLGIFFQAKIPEALRSQLDLPEGQGLLVGGVNPKSPAEKAGIEQHDVLLKAAGKPLTDLPSLIDVIDEAKETELAVELVRAGKRTTVKVTPGERPEQWKPQARAIMPQGPDVERIQEWLEKMQPTPDAEGGWRFHALRPGMILPRGAHVQPPLPGNLSVAITRHGKEPAKIVVQRGDDKWEVTEEELDKLPADVRPHVERMIGRGVLGPGFSLDTAPLRLDIRRPELTPGRPPLPPAQGDVRGQMKEMNREIQQLHKMMEEMRKENRRRQQRGGDPDKV